MALPISQKPGTGRQHRNIVKGGIKVQVCNRRFSDLLHQTHHSRQNVIKRDDYSGVRTGVIRATSNKNFTRIYLILLRSILTLQYSARDSPIVPHRTRSCDGDPDPCHPAPCPGPDCPAIGSGRTSLRRRRCVVRTRDAQGHGFETQGIRDRRIADRGARSIAVPREGRPIRLDAFICLHDETSRWGMRTSTSSGMESCARPAARAVTPAAPAHCVRA